MPAARILGVDLPKSLHMIAHQLDIEGVESFLVAVDPRVKRSTRKALCASQWYPAPWRSIQSW